jgi:hypothetical protein
MVAGRMSHLAGARSRESRPRCGWATATVRQPAYSPRARSAGREHRQESTKVSVDPGVNRHIDVPARSCQVLRSGSQLVHFMLSGRVQVKGAQGLLIIRLDDVAPDASSSPWCQRRSDRCLPRCCCPFGRGCAWKCPAIRPRLGSRPRLTGNRRRFPGPDPGHWPAAPTSRTAAATAGDTDASKTLGMM